MLLRSMVPDPVRKVLISNNLRVHFCFTVRSISDLPGCILNSAHIDDDSVSARVGQISTEIDLADVGRPDCHGVRENYH